jgi:hypothetical protein
MAGNDSKDDVDRLFPASNAASPLLVSSFCSTPYGDFYYLFIFNFWIRCLDSHWRFGLYGWTAESAFRERPLRRGKKPRVSPVPESDGGRGSGSSTSAPIPVPAAQVSVLLGFFEFFQVNEQRRN